MNFQVTVLKILASHPDGWTSLADLKRDMAILVTSGHEWSERTKRIGSGFPDLSIFSQALVVRVEGGWRITEEGREALARMEQLATPVATTGTVRERMATLPVQSDSRGSAELSSTSIENYSTTSSPGNSETDSFRGVDDEPKRAHP